MSADFAAMEAAMLQALVDRRWVDLSDLLDDDFVITTAGWLQEPIGKQAWLAEVADRHLVHDFKIHSVDVREMGDVAVILMRSTQSATWQSAPFEGDFRYTDVWRRDAVGQWRLAVRHATLLPHS